MNDYVYDVNYYDYDLPEDLIAQRPLKDRSSSKMLVLDKSTGVVKDRMFSDIIRFLYKGDVLVLNDTKVIPARLIGIKKDTNAVIELLLLKNIENDSWECLAKPGKRLHIGTIITFGSGELKAKVIEKKDEGIHIVELIYNGKLEDKDRYQTVYAKNIGSAAAPTAGLHFTKELLSQLQNNGIVIVYVTLHVGLGTFRPVSVRNIKDHDMHSEVYSMSEETANILNQAKNEKRRIISVGTTSTRTLESIISKYGAFKECSESTSIFIYPGYQFKAIDALITNFHLPKSTLVMLVSALAGRDNVINAYKHAIDNKYRFFSFGDAMFITNDVNEEIDK